MEALNVIGRRFSQHAFQPLDDIEMNLEDKRVKELRKPKFSPCWSQHTTETQQERRIFEDSKKMLMSKRLMIQIQE